MRIVSLLPSLTELVSALGRGDDLVGVTHECDFPERVATLPHLTRSRIPSAVTSSDIDALVAAQAGSLYDLDVDLLAELRPDLILTQEQCDVCAVNLATVRRAAERVPGSLMVESVNPTTLFEVLAMFRRIALLIDAFESGKDLVARFETTAREIARRQRDARGPTAIRSPRRVLLLEWLDPAYSSGHWNPDIVQLAGGIESVGRSGQKSRRLTWYDVAASHPDLILVSPCGFSLDRATAELATFIDCPEWRVAPVRSGAVAVVDGSAYFSRPGPRLETSLRIAAAAIDPESCADLAPPEGEGWRFWA